MEPPATTPVTIYERSYPPNFDMGRTRTVPLVEYYVPALDLTFNLVDKGQVTAWPGSANLKKETEAPEDEPFLTMYKAGQARHIRDGPVLTPEQTQGLRDLVRIDAERKALRERLTTLFPKATWDLKPKKYISE